MVLGRTSTLDLEFLGEPGNAMTPASATIYRKSGMTGEDGIRYLTAQCLSAKEVEDEVNRLKDELDYILKVARRKFKQK